VLERACEHDRRPELAEPAGEGERLGCSEPAAGERDRDSEERARRAGSERPGGVGVFFKKKKPPSELLKI
jgi:hypothetical protein